MATSRAKIFTTAEELDEVLNPPLVLDVFVWNEPLTGKTLEKSLGGLPDHVTNRIEVDTPQISVKLLLSRVKGRSTHTHFCTDK